MLGVSKKLVDLILPKSTAILVALALDGDPLACGPPCDEVYSNVSAIETVQHLTLGPAPDPVELEFKLAERALRGPVVGRKNHYGSRSKRGTEVAALSRDRR